MSNYRIKIIENGPYLVTGGVPLTEKIITEENGLLTYKDGRSFPLMENYALCRCGKSKNMPYCDANHLKINFNGKETASKELYIDQATVIEGDGLILTDLEDLCAFARFCHAKHGDVWELTRNSQNPTFKEEAIQAACDCPAGRLVAWDKETKEAFEPYYEPSIVLIQDPQRDCSGPIWVRGNIEIESANKTVYEVRNRVTLCRCGKSNNKPFCDAAHVMYGFKDN